MAKTKQENKEQSLEKTLWQAADKMRKNMDAAEYKHIVLGLIFLKYISDAFEEMYLKLKEVRGNMPGPIRKTLTNTGQKTFFMCRHRHDGISC